MRYPEISLNKWYKNIGDGVAASELKAVMQRRRLNKVGHMIPISDVNLDFSGLFVGYLG